MKFSKLIAVVIARTWRLEMDQDLEGELGWYSKAGGMGDIENILVTSRWGLRAIWASNTQPFRRLHHRNDRKCSSHQLRRGYQHYRAGTCSRCAFQNCPSKRSQSGDTGDIDRNQRRMKHTGPQDFVEMDQDPEGIGNDTVKQAEIMGDVREIFLPVDEDFVLSDPLHWFHCVICCRRWRWSEPTQPSTPVPASIPLEQPVSSQTNMRNNYSDNGFQDTQMASRIERALLLQGLQLVELSF